MPDGSSASRPGPSGSSNFDSTFIAVDVDASVAGDAELAKKLEEVCPVDIFKATDSGAEVVPAALDECVLCELCLDAAPDGSVVIRKLYDDTELRR
jgi:NAD-dependent dihydropyrimidine dehydrogenase PreA subunit